MFRIESWIWFDIFIVYNLANNVCYLQTQNMQGYLNREYVVWRRFSDFLGLHEKLIEKYFYKGYLVPAAPEKSIAALTRTKMNTSMDDNTNKLVDFGIECIKFRMRTLNICF